MAEPTPEIDEFKPTQPEEIIFEEPVARRASAGEVAASVLPILLVLILAVGVVLRFTHPVVGLTIHAVIMNFIGLLFLLFLLVLGIQVRLNAKNRAAAIGNRFSWFFIPVLVFVIVPIAIISLKVGHAAYKQLPSKTFVKATVAGLLVGATALLLQPIQ